MTLAPTLCTPYLDVPDSFTDAFSGTRHFWFYDATREASTEAAAIAAAGVAVPESRKYLQSARLGTRAIDPVDDRTFPGSGPLIFTRPDPATYGVTYRYSSASGAFDVNRMVDFYFQTFPDPPPPPPEMEFLDYHFQYEGLPLDTQPPRRPVGALVTLLSVQQSSLSHNEPGEDTNLRMRVLPSSSLQRVTDYSPETGEPFGATVNDTGFPGVPGETIWSYDVPRLAPVGPASAEDYPRIVFPVGSRPEFFLPMDANGLLGYLLTTSQFESHTVTLGRVLPSLQVEVRFVTIWPRIRYCVFGIPPLRQRQRPDGLVHGNQRQFSRSQPTSMQLSLRQNWRNTYL